MRRAIATSSLEQMQDGVEIAKRAAGRAAADQVPDRTRLGLGTGSTVEHLLVRLGERVAEGLVIEGVPTSARTAERARELGIPITTLDAVDGLDIAIDGADEVAPDGSMIKGGGAAMTREKIVASSAKQFWLIADPSKVVPRLGTSWAVPIEVLQFGWRQAVRRMQEIGLTPDLRIGEEGEPVRTDEGNLVIDAGLPEVQGDLLAIDIALQRIPGVVDTGLFLDFEGLRFVGHEDGRCEQGPLGS